MRRLSFVVGFLPWLVFAAMSSRVADNGVGWGAVVAFGVAAGCLGLERPVWPPKLIGVAQLLLFTAVAVAGFAGDADVDKWLFNWAHAMVTLVLGATIIVLVPFVPFTEQYSRESVAEADWATPAFHRINVVLSLAWGAAIVAMGLSAAAVSAIDQRAASFSDPHMLDLLLNWVLPIGITWYMINFTETYPDRITGDTT
jgi:hypothetical protein